ncbi:hypothetical protein F8388_003048 [Cannabis sativa]|uniref:Pentatricopeptide repeat-containing protein n=1 Tax=Cannabis sativa TaxID=3483 RepID=A0A7J6HDB0_CANSA|nr:hypothetical protein F8388_003048 [Cannabis sativa]
MVETEVKPDGYTYSFLLNACVKSGMFREGEQVHGRVFANGYCSNILVQTNLVNFYAVGEGVNRVENARRVFDDMHERNVVSWNSLLKGYVKCDDIDRERRVFDEMPERNVVSWTTMVAGLDQVALVSALSACVVLGDLELGRWIHCCGVINEAYEVFKKMPKRKTVSWTTIINGFAKLGRGEEALHVLWTMLSSRMSEESPDEINFIGALCACSHGGLVQDGRHIFKFMTQTLGIKPSIEHYGCMVDLLSHTNYTVVSITTRLETL